MLLSADEVSAAATHLVDAATDENSKVAFLAALAERGETEEEIAAFAAAFRRYAVDPGLSEWSGRAIDLCGTGGDHSGTVNISTAVAFVVAALGVPVIKHGNRSITSRSGSADVLEALGIRVERTPEQHRRVLASTGFTFLFAPVFHPAFRHIAPVRKRLAAEGKRSVFNLLGPLLNPARPAYQLLGVSRMELVRLIASALHRLEVQAGLVVCGSTDVENKGIDEATVCGPTLSRGCGRLLGVQTVWHADDFGATEAPLSALAGQGPIENARAIETVFTTCEPRAVAETIALNAALALWVAGRVSGPKAGYNAALEAMQNGQALATLRAVAAA
jgi:anthranilate phosphoribosyltransferase